MRPGGPGAGRDRSGGHRQGGLDQAGNARRRLGVTDARRSRAERRDSRSAAPQVGQRGQFGGVSCRGAGALALDKLDIRGIDPGLPVGLPGRLGCSGGRPDARGAPARYLGVHRYPCGARVGRPGQDHHRAAFPGQQPGRVGGVHAHLPGGQRARPGLQGEPDRVDAELYSAGYRKVEVTRLQRIGSRGDRMQGGRVSRLRIWPAGGEAELAAHQVAQARGDARDEQPDPGAPGHVEQARVGQGEGGHFRGQLLHRAQVVRS
jgi:hypothetical protein